MDQTNGFLVPATILSSFFCLFGACDSMSACLAKRMEKSGLKAHIDCEEVGFLEENCMSAFFLFRRETDKNG